MNLKIKNEEELSNVLGMAFASYSNRVARGEIKPYLSFIENAEKPVILSVSFEGSALKVELATPVVEAVQPLVFEEPVLEAQPTDTIIGESSDEQCLDSSGISIEELEAKKPKPRKRKK